MADEPCLTRCCAARSERGQAPWWWHPTETALISHLYSIQRSIPQVPPNAVLKYDVELVDFVASKESYEMSNEEKVCGAAFVLLRRGASRVMWVTGKVTQLFVLHTFCIKTHDLPMLILQVAAGEALKEKGNKAYKEGKMDRAVRIYDKVGRFCLFAFTQHQSRADL